MGATGGKWTSLAGYADLARVGLFYNRTKWVGGATNVLIVAAALGAARVVGGMVGGEAVHELAPPAFAKASPIPAITTAERTLLAAAPRGDSLFAGPLVAADTFVPPVDAPVADVSFGNAPDFASADPAAPAVTEASQRPRPRLLAAVVPPIAKIVGVTLAGAQRAAAEGLDELLPGGRSVVATLTDPLDGAGLDASADVDLRLAATGAKGSDSLDVVASATGISRTLGTVGGTVGSLGRTVGSMVSRAGGLL